MAEGGTEGVFTKRGPAERLHREAELLRRARHPGVVELVELRDDPNPVLVTRVVDGPSLAEGPPLPVEHIAGLVAALATTVADLHRLGVVHGAILPEHILVTSRGRPVLCGLGDGAEVDDPLEHARDVGALGELLRWLLARAPHPQTARRLTTGAVPALLALALRATSADPRMRPSARALATGARAAVPHATLPGQALARQPEPRQWPRALTRAVVAAVAVSVTLVAVTSLGGTSSPEPPAPPRAQAPPSTSVASKCAAVGGPLRADVDGDGCQERLAFTRGVLEAGAVQWAIGGDVDEVVAGDWNCDGRDTLAFLERATGGVYRLDAWPHARVVTVPRVAQVEGATGLRVAHRAQPGCDVLTVERASGPARVLG